MKPKHTPLTTQQFERLSRIQGWKVYEIPEVDWTAIPGLSRREDTIAVMGSADFNDPKLLNEIRAVAGFDQLVHESSPKPGEPEGNAYHFVIQQINHPNYPYLLHGPFKAETRVNHWFEEEDLDEYWSDGWN